MLRAECGLFCVRTVRMFRAIDFQSLQADRPLVPNTILIDIHEDAFSPEYLGQSIVQPTSRRGRIFSAVINKDFIGHSATNSTAGAGKPLLVHFEF